MHSTVTESRFLQISLLVPTTNRLITRSHTIRNAFKQHTLLARTAYMLVDPTTHVIRSHVSVLTG